MTVQFFLMEILTDKSFDFAVTKSCVFYLFLEVYTQYLEKVNDWVGWAIIGSLFIEENVTGDLYVKMLELTIDHLITHELETQINSVFRKIC